MIHVRVVAPPHRTAAVVDLMRAEPATINVTVLNGAAVDPVGDVVSCDVAREAVNDVLQALRDLGVHHYGTIAIEHVDASISDAAAEAERVAPGYGSDAAVWEEVDARVRDESALSAGFVALLVVASLIATVGLIEDSSILIVGAMVVGPEFGPIAGVSVGLFKRRPARIRIASASLGVGLGLGAVAAFVGTKVADAAGRVPDGLVPHDQPITGFIVEPSALSFVVALLAGVAGTLSLTQAKAGALIGVLISVTTIPAVAAIGLSSALGSWDDAGGAALQLFVNVSALVVAGVVTMWVQRELWRKIRRR